MTKEEAVKYIKSKMCNNCGIYLGGGKCSDNCKVIEAIKALETQMREDAISRQAVKEFVEYIQTIKDKYNDGGLSINYGTICALVIRGWKLVESEDVIKDMPPVNLQSYPDSISRSDMLDAIGHGTTYTSEDLQRIIRTLTPVNPQTKTGHWIQTQEKDDAEPCILWECSECHKEFRSIVHKVSNYCPNCGVKMVEPQESEGNV